MKESIPLRKTTRMQNHKKRLFKSLFVPLLVFFLLGCTMTEHLMVETLVSYPQKEKVDLHVALNVSDDLRNYVYEWRVGGPITGDRYQIHLGNILIGNIENLTRTVFKEVSVVTKSISSEKPDVDAYLTPKVAFMSHVSEGRKIGAKIGVEWSLTNHQNEVIWIKTIEGVGFSNPSFPTQKKASRKFTRSTIENLVSNSYKVFFSSEEIRRFVNF